MGLILGTFTTAFAFIIAVTYLDPFPSYWGPFALAVTVTAFVDPSSIASRPCLVVRPGILAVAFVDRPFQEVDLLASPFAAHQVGQLALAMVEHLQGLQLGFRRDLGWHPPLIGVLDLVGRQSYLEFYLL